MPPLPASSDIWTPDVIATVVYRVIMVIVSLAFIWKAYRQPVRAIDDEHVLGTILPHHRTRIPPSNSRSVFHDLITAQLESIVRSTLGIEDEGKDVPPLATHGNDNNSTSIACTDLEQKSEVKSAKHQENYQVKRVDAHDGTSKGRGSAVAQ